MHILMIAPEPFFEPRGTPFSEFHRIRALTTLGHTVDLVTYPFGHDVTMPGLRIYRSMRPWFVRRVRIGPSWAKVPLDAALALTALRRALSSKYGKSGESEESGKSGQSGKSGESGQSRKYDAVHSHEEGGAIGVVIARLLGVPHLYDMHSSLPQQVSNFGYGKATWLTRILRSVERLMIRRSRVVIVICEDLETTVRSVSADVPTVLIENAPGSGDRPAAGRGRAIRTALGLADSVPVVLYTGTFEAYQGLNLLYRAMSVVIARRPDARLVMVGGDADQVATARTQAAAAGAGSAVVFTGQRPSEEVPDYLDAATVLASPRSTGTNTPLKIYQYLRSGRPIVATNLRTHTQVLSADTAFLADPTPEAFGAAVLAAIENPARAEQIGRQARDLAETKYSDEAFIAKTRVALNALVAPRAGAAS